MDKPKVIFSKTIFAFLFICSLAFGLIAQTPVKQQQAESNYEVVLQILAASNDASEKSADAAPQTLSGVVKRLRTMYSFSNYRLNSTYVQRIANNGNLEFKGVLDGANQDVFAPVFSNFSIGHLTTLPDEKGQSPISITDFRFGQRVPIKTANFAAESGKSNSVINYEQIGLSMRKIGLTVNSPTVIGNLSASKPDEMMFLILTVKTTD